MKSARPGDTVIIHYIGTLDNGYIFDSRDEDAPLRLTLGNDEIFPALEREIIGMHAGQVKNILIAAEDAYGPRRDENILKVERQLFPAEGELTVGRKLDIGFADGAHKTMLIIAADEQQVTLDGNHQLAGLDLTFALKLVEIVA